MPLSVGHGRCHPRQHFVPRPLRTIRKTHPLRGYTPTVRNYSASEIAIEAHVPEERVAWLDSLGVLRRHDRGGFTFGSILVTKLISALIEVGIPVATIELVADEGWLNLGNVDEYLPHEPGLRSARSFREFQATAGPRGALLPTLYRTLGLPPPDPAEPIHEDEEEMFERFVEGWRLAGDDDALFRAARLIREGTRMAMLGWADLVDEQIAGPARGRLLRGDINRYPDEATTAFTTLTGLLPRMFSWLGARYVEQRVMGSIVEALEELLASRDLAPIPSSAANSPAIVFADLSGFTLLTEQQGDETAALTATLFQRNADTAATHHGGRLVKLLGDGALLRFSDPIAGVEAALELIETMSGEGLPSAHAGIDAGPVVERDLDVFGRTVNLASRIADAAAPGEVLVSDRVAFAAKGRAVDLERLKERSLKGIPEPVSLFRATRARGVSA
jgi:adenylate cyclase